MPSRDPNEVLREHARTYGDARDINPYKAMLDEVARAAGAVEWLEAQLALRHSDELLDYGSTARKWLSLLNNERQMLLKAADLCIKNDIADRQVRLAELQGSAFVKLMLAVAEDLHLSVEQQKQLPGLLRQHLAVAIEATAEPAG